MDSRFLKMSSNETICRYCREPIGMITIAQHVSARHFFVEEKEETKTCPVCLEEQEHAKLLKHMEERHGDYCFVCLKSQFEPHVRCHEEFLDAVARRKVILDFAKAFCGLN